MKMILTSLSILYTIVDWFIGEKYIFSLTFCAVWQDLEEDDISVALRGKILAWKSESFLCQYFDHLSDSN